MNDEIRNLITPILDKFGVTEEEVISKTRKREIAYCRFFCMKEVREKTFYTLSTIGNIFGGRDHTTVMHGINEAYYMADNPYIFQK